MHWAAKQGSVRVLEELDMPKTRWNMRSFGGHTPLHLACKHNHKDAAVLLIDFGETPPSLF